jgi:hypothetical protein
MNLQRSSGCKDRHFDSPEPSATTACAAKFASSRWPPRMSTRTDPFSFAATAGDQRPGDGEICRDQRADHEVILIAPGRRETGQRPPAVLSNQDPLGEAE